MDRRTLLKSAAAIPAVAMVPALPGVASAILVEPAVQIVPPPQLKPYADYVWEWMVSHDGETYYEAFPTKKEALEYAKLSEYSIVAECIKRDFDLSIDSYLILEHLDDRNMELIGEGEGIECTSAQAADPEVMVQKAIEAWVVKHDINLTAWSFGGVRNETKVAEALTVPEYNRGDAA